MNNTIFMITEIGILIGFGVWVSVIVSKLLDAVKELKYTRDVLLDVAKTGDRNIMEELAVQEKIYNNIYDLLETYGKQFDDIIDDYNIIRKYHQLINDNYQKLLNVWEQIDKRYDNTFEQFKFCSDELHKLNAREEIPDKNIITFNGNIW